MFQRYSQRRFITYQINMKTIQEQFEYLKSQPSDINEHLQTLHDLASECDHVTEFGVRTALSTTALLAWLKDWNAILVSYDLEKTKEVQDLIEMSAKENKNFSFRLADTREVEITPTDLLFIDTWHVADCLIKELERSAPKVRKYIAFHDTTTFAERWETEGMKGLKYAMDQYLADHKERKVHKVFTNNNWLTIWKRK